MPRLLRFAGTVLLAGAAALGGATPSQAEAPAFICTGTQTAHYAPPLGPFLGNTTVQVVERLGAHGGGTCTGPFTDGLGTAVFQEQASCLIPPPAGTLEPHVMTFHWDGGAHSTIDFPVTVVTRAAGQTIVTAIGTVVDGYGEGAPALREKVLPSLNLLECLAGRVERRDGTVLLAIGPTAASAATATLAGSASQPGLDGGAVAG